MPGLVLWHGSHIVLSHSSSCPWEQCAEGTGLGGGAALVALRDGTMRDG